LGVDISPYLQRAVRNDRMFSNIMNVLRTYTIIFRDDSWGRLRSSHLKCELLVRTSVRTTSIIWHTCGIIPHDDLSFSAVS
jgi:hypothetical protein